VTMTPKDEEKPSLNHSDS